MTISSTTTSYRYEGNGVTDTFAFSGRIFTKNDLVVEIITRATDVLEETLTITTDYTVTINSEESASVTTVVGKIPSATQDIQIRRSLTQSQTVDLPTGTAFPSKSVENALDKNIAIIQELNSDLKRSVKLSATSSLSAIELSAPVASEVIGWDSAGTALTSYGFSDLSASIDTVFTGLTDNDLLQYNSTSELWENVSEIDTDQIADDAITTDKIADDAITTDKIADGNVTNAKLADAELKALAELTSAANKVPYFTGSGTADVLDFLDQDDMSDDSATGLPSQQSVKSYVDSRLALVGAPVTIAGTETSVNFAIPAGAKKITVLFYAVKSATNSDLLVQIGTTTVATSGYNSTSVAARDTATSSGSKSTAGFVLDVDDGLNNGGVRGHMSLIALDTTQLIWSESHSASSYNDAAVRGSSGGGVITLATAPDILRVTTVDGVTFSSGKINVLCEY